MQLHKLVERDGQMRNVSVALQQGDRVKDFKWIETDQLNDQLGKPFQLLYLGSKVNNPFNKKFL